jgi:hypothetical protein
MTTSLKLLLDEVDMIAYASETQPVCSFYYDASIDSDLPVKRALTIVHRVNVHEQLLKALEAAESAISEAAEIMHYEDGLPVTFLESREIEIAHGTLVTVRAEVQKVLKDSRSPTASRKKGKRS